ncbi:hypothetical protein [Rhizobium leguminosarum]|uniref:hypothetical protein n=1 Tax=Rhizobium leguminosarum TaxID=384 RepID=UPI0010327997|nr:hypothetical protein [Rhizobium leguminosarum]TBG52564.1 hypothetical protein ELG74_36315 [Rhizobium leguminosarum]
MRYLAVFLLPTLLATSAIASEDAKFFIHKPVLQRFKFNGIEGDASFTITPLDIKRPLTVEQDELVDKYSRNDRVNLRKFGICYGLKDDPSMASMEYHACRVSSNEYEIGSETFDIKCRPGESLSISISLGLFAPEGLENTMEGQGVVKVGATEVKATYSVVRTALDEGDRVSIDYDFAAGGSLLRDLYDGSKLTFPTNSGAISVAIGSTNDALRDEVAHASSVCK